MPKITFIKDYRPKGDDPAIPTYKAGETYDLELSYADKYKRRGYAVDYVEPVVAVPEPAEKHPEPSVEAEAAEAAEDAERSNFSNRGGKRR